MIGNLKVGDKLIAMNSDKYDRTTKDSEYEVEKVQGIGFFIRDDTGTVIFPISTTFRRA
ncbi:MULTISPECIES: hypothetical protein [Bacillus cereus group]|uniref:hypothetical protein n=1 Tax=Bacillus cereus group TaxID=86661 RepID=UPI001482C4B0|nr:MULTISPECIES: hypothetical protein [Bacillus cereus group]MEC3196797.1 hypothetical protein [Bacillus cereus]